MLRLCSKLQYVKDQINTGSGRVRVLSPSAAATCLASFHSSSAPTSSCTLCSTGRGGSGLQFASALHSFPRRSQGGHHTLGPRLSPRRRPGPSTRTINTTESKGNMDQCTAATASAVNGVEDLNIFLGGARAAVDGSSKLMIVMGNESADLDSIVSAVLYAFLLVLTSTDEAPGAQVVPLVNIPRGDLALRTDAAWVLDYLGVDVAQLVFIDEVDVPALRIAGRLEGLVLVDHNRLAANQEEALLPAVVEIIDHHVDEGRYPETATCTIQVCGSTCSLVAKEYAKRAPHALQSAPLAYLLLAGILLDTGNLDPALGRTSPLDEEMNALLTGALTPGAAGGMEPGEYYEALRRKRFDVSALATRDLLRKDYKQWGMAALHVGISAVGMDLPAVAAKDPRLAQAIDEWAAERELDLLLIMTAYFLTDGTFARQLAVVPSATAPPTLLPSLTEHLKESGVELVPLEGVPHLPSRALAFTQPNVKLSRKQIQPIVAAFFDKSN